MEIAVPQELFHQKNMVTWADYQGQVQNSDAQATITDGTISSGSKAGPKHTQIPGSEDLWNMTTDQDKTEILAPNPFLTSVWIPYEPSSVVIH